MDKLQKENQALKEIIITAKRRGDACIEQLARLVSKTKILTMELREKNVLDTEKSDVEKRISKRVQEDPAAAAAAAATASGGGGGGGDIAKELQQFYTIDELATECIEKFRAQCPTLWEDPTAVFLEPSAGEGDILEKLPKERRFGVDLDPKHSEVVKMNFFETSRQWMEISESVPLALVGNPPFGDIASEFFNHATNVLKADYIAWILPNSFLTRKRRDKINRYYHLVYVMNITCCYTHKGQLVNLPTMFGIWEKKNIPTIIPLIVKSSPHFTIISAKGEKDRIYKKEINPSKYGSLEPNKYFWMRKTIQHKQGEPQSPVFLTAEEFKNSYKGVWMPSSSPYDKLLDGYLIECIPEYFDSVVARFSQFNWKENIGQFDSVRGTKDWGLPTRIKISIAHIYSAYNNDLTFQPYTEQAVDIHNPARRRASQLFVAPQVIREQSAILRQGPTGIIATRTVKGGTRKKRKRKTKRRRRRKR